MKKPLHRFLIIAAALSASLAFAQNPPRPDGQDWPDRPERRDDPRGPEGRDFPDGPPPRQEGDRPDRPTLRDRQRNAPASLPQKSQPYLGVVTRALDSALGSQLGFTPGLGLIIEDTVPDGPAAKAGLQKMDVIKQLNDQLVSNPGHLAALVRHFGKDADVTVLVLRKGQEQKIAVKIGEHLAPEFTPLREDFSGGNRGGGDTIESRRQMENQRRDSENQRRDGERQRREGEDRERGARDPQGGPEPRVPRPSMDILREVGPGGPPEVRAREEQSSTTWNTASARVMLKDQNGEIEMRSDNGKRTLVAKSPKGDTVFNGPIDTEEQRKAVPAEFRKMLEQVEAQSRAGGGRRGGAEARASAGSFGPLPLDSERLRPRQPEVQ